MKQLKSLWKHTTVRMFAYIVPLALFAGLVFMLMVVTLYQNRDTIYNNLEQNQRELNLQIANNMVYLSYTGATDEEILEYARTYVLFTGKRYLYVLFNGEVAFARDSSMTNQYINKPASEFTSRLSKDDFLVTQCSFMHGDSNYIVGIVTERDAMNSEWEIAKLSLYAVTVIAGAVLVFITISVWLVISYDKKKEIAKKCTEELKQKNQAINDITLQLEKTVYDLEQAKQEIGRLSNRFFDVKIIQKILEKSDLSVYRPLSIMIVKLLLKDRYCTKDEITDFSDAIRTSLTDDHILAEVTKGEFVVLLYAVDEKEAGEIAYKISEAVKEPSGRHRIQANIGVATTTEVEIRAVDLFSTIREELMKSQSKDQ